MKRYILAAIMTICLPLVIVAEQDCLPANPQIMTNFSSPIEVWGSNYQACMLQEWDLMLPDDNHTLEFNYIIDLNPNSCMDVLLIYGEDDNHVPHEYLNYAYQPMSGSVQIYSSSGIIRVLLISEFGNSGNLYQGFKLSYSSVINTSYNQVIYSNVGIGIQPQEKLHVNGPVRGDGENGAWRIRTTTGITQIGSVSGNYSHFYTDRPAYFFDKPLYIAGGRISPYGGLNELQFYTLDTNRVTIDNRGKVGIGTDEPEEALHVNGFVRGDGGHGALRVRTECGVTAIGCDSWAYSHFDTDRPRFFFYKPIMIRGEVSSAHGYDLKLQTYDYSAGNPSTRMTILRTNGNVGIGTETPTYKLDVAGQIRATGMKVQTSSGADFVFDESYKLQSLSDVESFVNKNKHLPGIQSATNMQENGIDVSEFQIQLLQKIEELTLYIIQQDKTIKELQDKVEQLSK